MSNERKVFRHELKYLISYGERELLREKLKTCMKIDDNASSGSYKIRSIYFDDYWNTAYFEKKKGIQHRKKYRIRFYNDSDSLIKLERKIKNVSWIHKSSVILTRDETESVLAGEYDFLLNREEQLCQEFYYQCKSRVLRPKCIVDYEREPYVFEAGDVRITFDTDVRSVAMIGDIFDSELPAFYVLEPEKLVLEVKFTDFLPELIKQALPSRADFQAFSKFVSCFESLNCVTEVNKSKLFNFLN